MHIEETIVEKYKKGSTPSKKVTQMEVNELITLLKTVSQKTKKDYQNGVFKTFNTYTTSVGFTLKNIEDSLNFNPYHEGIHLGIILAIKKLI